MNHPSVFECYLEMKEMSVEAFNAIYTMPTCCNFIRPEFRVMVKWTDVKMSQWKLFSELKNTFLFLKMEHLYFS